MEGEAATCAVGFLICVSNSHRGNRVVGQKLAHGFTSGLADWQVISSLLSLYENSAFIKKGYSSLPGTCTVALHCIELRSSGGEIPVHPADIVLHWRENSSPPICICKTEFCKLL